MTGVCSGVTSYTDINIDIQTNTNALTNILLMLMPIPIPILLNANINASTISDTNYLIQTITLSIYQTLCQELWSYYHI